MSSDWIDASPWARLWPEGTDRLILDETDSTMAEAARRAPPQRPTWILARHQTAARARRGRPWIHPPGNFAATLLLPYDGAARQAALLSFVAALALRDALAAWVEPADLSLKWPNDVLLKGRKVAGILLEASGKGDMVDWISVGIGVNLLSAPPATALEPGALPPIALADAAPWPRYDAAAREPEVFLAHLALGFSTHAKILAETDFDMIRLLWLGHAAGLGTQITVRTGNATLHGRFDTLDPEGCLVLETAEGPRRIAAGEVFFG